MIGGLRIDREDIPEPQGHIYALVNGRGELATEAASGRWAFRTPQPAHQRAHHDRQVMYGNRMGQSRVARYKFDGWA